MSEEVRPLNDLRLKTPRAAAVAGILFAVLHITANLLIRLSIPSNPTEGNFLLEEQARNVALGLSLVPIGGITFLWFIGVIRDRMGELEDRFFSSVFFGSGLLYLAMMFISAALAGGILTSYTLEPDLLISNGIYIFSREVMFTITNVYAIRMAGVFMISLGTIAVRTRIMPRWLTFLTYSLAFVLLVSFGLNFWVTLIFPGWVLVVSFYILVLNLHKKDADK
jgi:hypothetical protein